MGVLLTAALIVAGTAVGVGAEHRYPTAAVALARRFLRVILYVLVPIVIFFNLAKASISLDNAVGLGLGLAEPDPGRGDRLVRRQPGAAAEPRPDRRGDRLRPGRQHRLPRLPADRGAARPRPPLDRGALRRPGQRPGADARRVRGRGGVRRRAGEGLRERAKTFLTRNPPLYAAILGLLAPAALAPDGLVDASQVLAVAVLPIGFFAVGATLAEGAEHGELPFPPPFTRPVALAVGARLALAPALLMLLAAPLIDLPSAYRLMSAMPTGLNAMIVSHAYGLDNRTVAESITWSTAIVVAAALISLLF